MGGGGAESEIFCDANCRMKNKLLTVFWLDNTEVGTGTFHLQNCIVWALKQLCCNLNCGEELKQHQCQNSPQPVVFKGRWQDRGSGPFWSEPEPENFHQIRIRILSVRYLGYVKLY